MKVRPIKTRLIKKGEKDFAFFLKMSLKRLPENSIVVVTSKIVSFFEGNLLPKDGRLKDELIPGEADYYLPRQESLHHTAISIRESAFISSGGIDESNADGHYVLLPRDVQKSANVLRRLLQKEFSVKNVGVIISDSRSIPLRRGAIGVALAWSGFKALEDYRGTEDLFGRTIQYEVANIADALAIAAVVTMGEGNERQPLALLTDIPFVQFVQRNPTPKERALFFIKPADDFFAPLFNFKKLKKGQRKT
jgi:F420-0:gamma-glutamyl ligase